MTDPMCHDDAEPDSPAFEAAGLTLDIDMRAAAWQPFCEDLRAHAAFLLTALALPPVELSLVLGDDALLAELNQTYRDKVGPTNVLSFPALDLAPQMDATEGKTGEGVFAGALLGDIVMSFDTLAREAQTGGVSLTAHMLHLLTHGFLHLLGHDHMQEQDAQIMEALESRLMLAAGLDDPYAARATNNLGASA
jgi:probable rRNA maturation factor